MQVKMIEILNFASFYEAVRTQKLNIKTAYKLNQLARAIDTEVKFYQEKFQEILNEYGEKDENGNLVTNDGGAHFKLREGTDQECFAAVNDLQQLDTTLPDITFVIEDFQNVELSADQIAFAMPFLTE